MRFFAGALLAILVAVSIPGRGDLAVTLGAQHEPQGCAVVSIATIMSYGTAPSREVRYRFVRSDGSVTPVARLILAGDGAVAQAVTDRWLPRGPAPWVAVEIIAPKHVRSPQVAVGSPCERHMLAATR